MRYQAIVNGFGIAGYIVAVAALTFGVHAVVFQPHVTVTEHGKPCPHHREGTSTIVWTCP